MKRVILARALLAVASLYLISGCATVTSPKVSESIADPTFQKMAEANEPVYLLTPYLIFENALTENALEPSQHGGEKVAEIMMTEVPLGLEEAGFNVMSINDISSEKQAEVADLSAKLGDECRVATSRFKDKSTLIPLLNQLGERSGCRLVGFQIVKAKLGAGSTYDPNSGAMAQGTSTTSIKLCLVSSVDGNIVWENESFLRYEPTSGKFGKAVRMLATSMTQGGKGK